MQADFISASAEQQSCSDVSKPNEISHSPPCISSVIKTGPVVQLSPNRIAVGLCRFRCRFSLSHLIYLSVSVLKWDVRVGGQALVETRNGSYRFSSPPDAYCQKAPRDDAFFHYRPSWAVVAQ